MGVFFYFNFLISVSNNLVMLLFWYEIVAFCCGWCNPVNWFVYFTTIINLIIYFKWPFLTNSNNRWCYYSYLLQVLTSSFISAKSVHSFLRFFSWVPCSFSFSHAVLWQNFLLVRCLWIMLPVETESHYRAFLWGPLLFCMMELTFENQLNRNMVIFLVYAIKIEAMTQGID